MYIEELKGGGEAEGVEEGNSLAGGGDCSGGNVVVSDTKRVLIGAGARALFYPTLFYNVVRNKIQADFRWWDKIDEVYLSFFTLIYLYSIIIVSRFCCLIFYVYVFFVISGVIRFGYLFLTENL